MGKKTKAVRATYTPHHKGVFCEACKHSKPPVERLSDIAHHPTGRTELSAEEINDPKFQMYLCNDHHTECHFNGKTSGIRFYKKYNLLEMFTARCGNDKRWLKWVRKQENKQ